MIHRFRTSHRKVGPIHIAVLQEPSRPGYAYRIEAQRLYGPGI